MKKIHGKSVLVRVCARFELASLSSSYLEWTLFLFQAFDVLIASLDKINFFALER